MLTGLAFFANIGCGAAPHGEYSTSNVGSVDAYGVCFVSGCVFSAVSFGDEQITRSNNGDDGGDLASGRFRLGVIAFNKAVIEFELVCCCFGVMFCTSRKAVSNFEPNAMTGVLDTFCRAPYGCGVN